MATRFTKVWQRLDFIFNLTAGKRRQDAAIKVLHDFTYNIIQSRRKMCETSDLKFDGVYEDAEIGSKKKLALLDVLLHAKINDHPLTDEEIKEEVDTFMFEGHDTTTGAICFTVYLLSRYPRVQDKLFEELRHALGENQQTGVTYRNLQNLKYLELVIKESLRLYPPVPIIGRIVQEDVNLNGRVIPAHSKFNIGIYHMHRDPDLFPNPEQFLPERFDLDNTLELANPYVFVPFSAGPRNCIGALEVYRVNKF
jgi:cytochrome P450 family 4